VEIPPQVWLLVLGAFAAILAVAVYRWLRRTLPGVWAGLNRDSRTEIELRSLDGGWGRVWVDGHPMVRFKKLRDQLTWLRPGPRAFAFQPIGERRLRPQETFEIPAGGPVRIGVTRTGDFTRFDDFPSEVLPPRDPSNPFRTPEQERARQEELDRERMRQRQAEMEARFQREIEERAARIAAIRETDPDFAEDRFLAQAAASFVRIQRAWSDRDLPSVRHLLSDGVYNRFDTYLDTDRLRHRHNRLADVSVERADLHLIRIGADFQIAVVRFEASLVDQTFDTRSGERVQGSPSPDRFSEYWTFARRPGAASRDGSGFGLDGAACPGCGAPFSGGQTNRCDHCGALVNSGVHDWVLAEITQAGLDALAAREVAIPAEVERAAPDLSLAQLEDRVSAMFWALIRAALRGEVGELRRLAIEPVYRGLSRQFEGARARRAAVDVGVGSVQTRSTSLGEDGCVRAEVEVSWSGARTLATDSGELPSGERFHRRDRFVVMRERGRPSRDLGLATAGCGACGGTLDRGDDAECPWCSASIAPAPGEWRLTFTSIPPDILGPADRRQARRPIRDP